MSPREDAYARHQQARWLRPDAARWVRPDAARYLAPNADIGAIFPALERKYSPDQPRVPAGNPDGGQWTDGSLSGSLGLFQIKPRERRTDGVQLAGEPPTGDGPNVPTTEPPPIPPTRPKKSADATRFLRAAANWLKGASKIRADIFTAAIKKIEWLNDRHALIEAARDEPNLTKSCRTALASVGRVTTITMWSNRHGRSTSDLSAAGLMIRLIWLVFRG